MRYNAPPVVNLPVQDISRELDNFGQSVSLLVDPHCIGEYKHLQVMGAIDPWPVW